jgi:hypothetical protein
MAQSALRGLVSGLMQGGPAPSGMASAQTAIQNAAQRPQSSADLLGGLSQFTSLDTPQDMSLGATLADIGMGFAPGIGTAQGVRDFERARRDEDALGMLLGGLGVVGAGGIIKAGRGIGRAVEGAMDMSQAARMQRAREQGFDVDNILYHGTDQEFDKFNVEGMGKTAGSGAFFTDDPKIAETYLSLRGGNILPVMARKSDMPVVRVVPYEDGEIPNWSDISRVNYPVIEYPDGTQDDLFDVFELDDVASTDEIAALAREKGFPGITIEGIRDAGPNSHIYNAKEYLKNKYGIDVADDFSNVSGSQFAEARQYVDDLYKRPASITSIFDPSYIRSVNAAFDPAKRNSANLMAGVMGGAVGLSALRQLMPQQEQE